MHSSTGALVQRAHKAGAWARRLPLHIQRAQCRSSRFLPILLCLIALLSAPGAWAQSAANGSTLFHGNTYACYSCHSAGFVAGGLPRLPQLNAAGAAAALTHAIQNNAGAYMATYRATAVDGGANGALPLSASDRADIAAYLQQVNSANFPASVSVAYQSSSAAIPLKLDLTTGQYTSISYGSPARGTVAAGTSVGYTSLQGTAGQESTAVYTHTASNCTADSFNVSASGPAGTSSVRTINVTVTPPSAPTASTAGPIAAAYNTATAIPITLGGGPTASIQIVTGLANGGSLSTNGTTSFTYTSNAAAYSASDSFTYRAVGPCGSTSSNVTVNINISAPPAPVITSATTASGNGGQAFSYQITANNLPSSFGVTGTLPNGVSLNTSTGVISGTPTQTGSFPVTLHATNSAGTGNQALTITINTVTPFITSSTTASGTGGQAFSYQITANNLPASFGVTGTLPAGLGLNTATGVISGTPTELGSFPVTIHATNAAGTGNQALTITVAAVAPVITSGTTAGGTGGQPFSYQITANNLPSSYGVTGALPAGVSINTSSGLISGTPTSTGSFPVTISATNASGSGTQALTITITLVSPSVTSAASASGTGGQAFSYQITADNLPSSYSVSGTLPAGVSVNTTTGLISGTPTESGSFPVTVNAHNAAGPGSRAVTITIGLVAPAITSAASASGTSGQAFSYQITAGNLPASFGASGLPPGVAVNAGTGLVSGTPSVGGTFNATVSATNAAGTGSQALTITLAFVAPGAAATTVTVPYNTAATINLPVTGQFTQVNITTPPAHGTLPAPGAGVTSVTYTPQAGYTGADSFSYSATGPGGTSAVATVSITVDTLAPSAGAATLAAQLNTPVTFDLAPYITGSGITGVAIASQPAHGSVSTNGTAVIYTPAQNYFGPDSFSYTAYGNAGTSPPGLVSVTVAGRPDVAQDAKVTAMVAAQAETAQRFARAQVSNFHTRLESLHRRGSGGSVGGGAGGAGFAGAGRSVAGIGAGMGTFAGTGLQSGLHGGPGAAAGASPFHSPGGNFSARLPAHGMHAAPAAAGFANGVIEPGSALGSGVYKPAATLSQTAPADPGASRALPAQSALPMLMAALSAGADPGKAAAADLGTALLSAANAVQTGSLNLNFSTGHAEGQSGLPAGMDFWIGGGVKFGSRARGARNGGMSFTTDGVSMGVDRRFSQDLALGVGLGYAQDKSEFGTDGTATESRSVTLAAYGSYQPDEHLFLDGVLGYGMLDFHSDRFVTPANAFARSDRKGSFVFASLTGGYEFRTRGMLLAPYGRVDIARHTLDAATESGAGAFALRYERQSSPSLQFSLGLRAETAHETRFGWVLPRLRAEYQHEFKDPQPARVSYADLVGGPYFLPAAAIDRNAIVLGAGSDFLLPRGLTLSLDYQVQRLSSQEENQGVFFKLRKNLDGTPHPKPLASFTRGSLGIDTEFAYTYDDNLTRAERPADQVGDSIYSLDLSRRFMFPLSDRSRLLLRVFAGGDKHRVTSGLDRLYAGGAAELQFRPEGSFGSPTYAVFANATASAYESDLRDGYRTSAGVSVHKPLTDRINLFAALARNQRVGKSAVFDNSESSARLNLDYAFNPGTLYLTGELRHGDIVSTGTHTLSNINISEVFVRDDVFTRPQWYSYRFDGRTVLLTLGYSFPLGQKDALDLSLRRVGATPSRTPFGSARPRYSVNQLTLVYLTSF